MSVTVNYDLILGRLYALTAAHDALTPEGVQRPALLSSQHETLLRALIDDSSYLVTSMAGARVVAALDADKVGQLTRRWYLAVALHVLSTAYEATSPELSRALYARVEEMVAQMRRDCDSLPGAIKPSWL